MIAKTAIAVALAAGAAAADGQTSTTATDYCTANAERCPIAAVFKKTGKTEVAIADMVKDFMENQKGSNGDAAVKEVEQLLVAMDTNKDTKISKIEYNIYFAACRKVVKAPESKPADH